MKNTKHGVKRVFIGSDFHCGHIVGLTPEQWRSPGEIGNYQAILWDWFIEKVSKYKPFHTAILNGDLIDGKGAHTGGTEQITTDRIEQADMAIEVARLIDADNYRIAYGTPYHTGKDEDYEKMVANALECKIESEGHISINKTRFEYKHKVAGTTVPYGGLTAAGKASLQAFLWTDAFKIEKPCIVVRSHVHMPSFGSWKIGSDWIKCIVTPGLQGLGSKYARQVNNVISFGFCVVDCFEDGTTSDITFVELPMKGQCEWEIID